MSRTDRSGSELDRRWRSLHDGYLPPQELIIDPGLRFHNGFEREIDSVTYEVIRSKFWNLNWDHQETIRRTSGSLVVVQGYDFNSSLHTEHGQGVVFGPGNLFFAGCADVVISWTLEHRSQNVGIRPGDVFIQDDPWIGTNHAMDTAIYRPVFVGDSLFAWVYNVAHERELGGVEPGGFVQTAQDVYSEATFWPPVKLVDRGELREDLLDAWVRRSRVPGLMTVEVKAQLAGARMAHDRLLEIIEKFGPELVKGVMRKMIADTARTVGQRLSEVPDGTWRDVRYAAGASPGDRRLYRLEMSMEKRGDRLTVSNEGTDPPAGSFNITAGTLRACILSPLLLFLAYDQYLCGAGVLEQVDFRFSDNAINSACHPAAISTSLGLGMSLVQAQHLAAKMLSSSEESRRHVFAASGLHTLIYNHMFGVDRNGTPFAHFPFDGTVGGIGAFAFRDGIDHGGGAFSAVNPVGSVEAYEQEIPFLYLYRRELSDSGGHGRWRGGATFVSAWTGHKSSSVFISSGGLIPSVTQGIGLLGGFPSSGGTMWHATGTNILGAFAEGKMPRSPDDLREFGPNGGPPPMKTFDNRLSPGDLFEVMPQPGAGYGDPLLREIQRVEEDLDHEKVTREDARVIYGVVISPSGVIDVDATAEERRRRREQRLDEARPPRRPVDSSRLGPIQGFATETVGFVVAGDKVFYVCSSCERPLGERTDGYREGCAEHERSLMSIGSVFMDPATDTDAELVFRQYLCPGCGVALDGEVCQAADFPVVDVVLESPAALRVNQ